MLEVDEFTFDELDQMNSVPMFPIFLKLEGRSCLVVGAGTIAAPKIDSLLRAGGVITVVAPRATQEIEAKARAGELVLHLREFAGSDLDGAFLVVTATDLQPVNHLVAEAARERNVLCN
jgi:siroheme synthase-like protein